VIQGPDVGMALHIGLTGENENLEWLCGRRDRIAAETQDGEHPEEW